MIARGTLNRLVVSVGDSGTGKTHAALREMADDGETALRLIYDPSEECRLDGRIIRHDSYASLRDHTGNWWARLRGYSCEHLHALDWCRSAADAMALVHEICRHRKRAGNPYPVYLLIDEAADVQDEMGTSHIHGSLLLLVAKRRPLHLGLWINSQWAKMIHSRVLYYATTIHMYRQGDSLDLDRLRERRISDLVLETLPTLPSRRRVTLYRDPVTGQQHITPIVDNGGAP